MVPLEVYMHSIIASCSGVYIYILYIYNIYILYIYIHILYTCIYMCVYFIMISKVF